MTVSFLLSAALYISMRAVVWIAEKIVDLCFVGGCRLDWTGVIDGPWPGWHRYPCKRCGLWTLVYQDLYVPRRRPPLGRLEPGRVSLTARLDGAVTLIETGTVEVAIPSPELDRSSPPK